MKTVLTHGYVLDEKGYAMGKVWQCIRLRYIPKFGARCSKTWVSSEDYCTDNKIGLDHLNQIVDSYRKHLQYLSLSTRKYQRWRRVKVLTKLQRRLTNGAATCQFAQRNCAGLPVPRVSCLLQGCEFRTVDLSNTYFEIVRVDSIVMLRIRNGVRAVGETYFRIFATCSAPF